MQDKMMGFFDGCFRDSLVVTNRRHVLQYVCTGTGRMLHDYEAQRSTLVPNTDERQACLSTSLERLVNVALLCTAW